MDAESNLGHDLDDPENYASDASENDDIIDDDQELLALLRGEHSALHDATSSSTGISTHATTHSQEHAGLPVSEDGVLGTQKPQQRLMGELPNLETLPGILGQQRDAFGLNRLSLASSLYPGAPTASDTIPARSFSISGDPILSSLDEITAVPVEEDMVPPDNEDAIKRRRRYFIDPGSKKRWLERERENLKAGVISENKRILFEAFSEAGDVDGIRALNSVPDSEMMVNTKGLDWNRISQRFVDSRTPKECLIQWTGMDHPGISKADWTAAELTKLDELAKQYHERNWIQIALDLGTNRTSAQCFKKYMSGKATKSQSKEPWSEKEDSILKEAVQVMGEKNWQQISHCFDNRTAAQCMYRWTKSINPAIRRGRWTEEEDGALRMAATMYGESYWTKVQHHIIGRTDVQCRERYMNVLSPKVKSGPWSKEENEKLVGLVEGQGMTKWSDIALKMEGRTDNQCARRYRMICKEREERTKLYLSTRRRKGRTTLAQLPEPKTEEELEAERRRKKRRDKIILRQKRIAFLEQVKHSQEQELRGDYNAFASGHRRVYDMWDERWGKFLDPIEKVFNLGIPHAPQQDEDEDEDEDMDEDQTISVTDPKVPDAASVLRPGRIRPVPPCFATMNAFSRNIAQGEYSDGRFRLRREINHGEVVEHPLSTAPLSSEEMNRPEYKELADRFDAVFLWPMMMGMLHMGAARELIETPTQVLLQDGAPSQLQPAVVPEPANPTSVKVTQLTRRKSKQTEDFVPTSPSASTSTSTPVSGSKGKRKSKQVDDSVPASSSASTSRRKDKSKQTEESVPASTSTSDPVSAPASAPRSAKRRKQNTSSA
ncbi:Myb-like DNA-binding domain protein [Mortierella sp. GBA43]|nr:Myb-like DNA-binding domain protein [Mortierella sp. GBA43]